MAIGRLESGRLVLEPLALEHVDELGPLLDDPALHEFIGGRPPTNAQLAARVTRQLRGHSPDGRETWLNWVVRLRDTGCVVGTAQATLTSDEGGIRAVLAWVIGTRFQGQGLAKESAGLLATWLREQGVDRLAAHIHPDHEASMGVARSIGLTATETVVHGEVGWQSPPA